MIGPEASAFAWIFVVKPPRERPSARPSCPGGGDVRARDRRVEHLNEMGGSAHRGERVEKRLEHAGLAQMIEALPDAVPMTEPLRKRGPLHILDRKEMQRLQKQAVVLGHMRRILSVHPRRHQFRPPNR